MSDAPSRALTFPSFDLQALERALEAERSRLNGADIKTRSQILLEGAEARAKELEIEAKDYRARMTVLEKHIASMNDILARMQAAEQDVSVELSAVLGQINLLRQAGVQL